MPCDINVTYTPLKSAFNGLQFRRWQYGSIFIHLAVIASETREMSRNSKRIWPYSSSRSSKVIDLGVNGKLICNFLLVINCNFSRPYLLPFSRYSRLKIENCWFYAPLPCLTLRLGWPFQILWWIWHQKTRIVHGATRWWRNHDASFLRFDTIPARHRHTDGRTDRHVALAKTRASIASRG